MICSLSDLKDKEVINIRNGKKLGYVDDVELNTETSMIIAFIVYGNAKLFGLLGREDDIIISCKEIEVIGEDTILVRVIDECSTKKRSFSIKDLYK